MVERTTQNHKILAASGFGAAVLLFFAPSPRLKAVALMMGATAVGYGSAAMALSVPIKNRLQYLEGLRQRLGCEFDIERQTLLTRLESERCTSFNLHQEVAELAGKFERDRQALAAQIRKELSADYEKLKALLKNEHTARLGQIAGIEQSKRAELEREYQAKLSTAAGQLQSKAQAQLAHLEATLRRDLAEAKRLIQAAAEKRIADAESAAASAEVDKLAKIKARNAEHRRREQYLLSKIEELKETIEQRDTQLREEFTKAIQPYEELYEELDAALAVYAQGVEGARSEFTIQYQSKLEEVDRLHTELRQYRNPSPFRGVSKADIVGNKLIDFFMARGIVLDAERCEAKLDRSIIWVRPRGTTLEGIKTHDEDLQLAFELIGKPKIEIDSGCLKFELPDARIETPRELPEPAPERLLEALAKSNHVRINAPTESGKSTLLDNVLNAYRILHSGEFELTLLDPKYPFTPWQGHQPNYKGFDQCLNGIVALSRTIEARLNEARECADKGEPIPSYQPHLFAVDELEALHDDALEADGNKKGDVTKGLEKAIRTGLKVGQGLTLEKGKGIKVLYITQSPLCSRIGLNKDDFDQSTNIYLGTNIAIVLQDSGELDNKIPDAKRRSLQREYEARLAEGQTYIMLVRMPNGGECFLMKMPTPGYWYQRAKAEGVALDIQHQAIVKALQCPECGSESIVKNGKGSKGRTRYKCKACSKSFQA